MTHGGDVDAGKRELVTVTQPVRRMQIPRDRGLVVTIDERGRMHPQECDRDLIDAALTEHYRRRTH